MGFALKGNAAQGGGEGGLGGLVVVLEKFPRHPRPAHDEIGAEGRQHLQDRGNAVHERDIHRLDFRPEGKAAVGDDQRVGVAHPAEQMVEAGI